MDYPEIKRVKIFNGDMFAEVRNSDLLTERQTREEWEMALADDIREFFSKCPQDVKDYCDEKFVRWINALQHQAELEGT